MTIIKARLNDQALSLSASPVVASGGVGEDSVTFVFDDTWTGYTKKAVFYRDESTVYHVDIGSDNTAVIPWEVLQYSGFMYFGVFGTKGDEIKTSTVIRYRVECGAITSATQLDPTPDIFADIVLNTAARHTHTMICGQYDTKTKLLQMDVQDPFTQIKAAYENGDAVTANINFGEVDLFLPLTEARSERFTFAAPTGFAMTDSTGAAENLSVNIALLTVYNDETAYFYEYNIYDL